MTECNSVCRNLLLHPGVADFPEGREAVRKLEKVIPACHKAGVQGQSIVFL